MGISLVIMKNLLNKIPEEILNNIIGFDRLKKINAILNDDSYVIDLPELIYSFHGNSILENNTLRKEIIKLLPEHKLNDLAIKYCGKKFSNKESSAIQLAAKNWVSSSKLPYDIISLLNLGMEYLPKRSKRLNTVEFIEPIEAYYPLFDYQKEIKNKIVSNIKDNCRFLVQMPTGSGKTKTCMESLVTFNSKKKILESEKSFIWIAHTEELCEQAIYSLRTIWQHNQKSTLRIIRYWGGYEPAEEELYGSFVFSTYQKLGSKKSNYFNSILSKTCSVVVVDEAHKAVAPTYRLSIDNICEFGANLIGLTATPGRSISDKLDNLDLAKFFNKNMITPTFSKNPIEALREKKILSKVLYKTIESEVYLNIPEKENSINNFEFSSKQLQLLSINSNRNRLIIEIIKKEIKINNPCLVFTCSVEHSVILAGILKFLGIKAAYVDSNIKKSRRRKIISDFKNNQYDVLLNFGILTTGFDAPRIQTIIITRPTTSIVLYSQMIGRGLRGKKIGGNVSCNIIDIKDNYEDFGYIENIYNYFSEYWK